MRLLERMIATRPGAASPDRWSALIQAEGEIRTLLYEAGGILVQRVDVKVPADLWGAEGIRPLLLRVDTISSALSLHEHSGREILDPAKKLYVYEQLLKEKT